MAASFVSLRKFVAPVLVTASVIHFLPGSSSSRYVNADAASSVDHTSNHIVEVETVGHKSPFRHVADSFRTASYSLTDFVPSAPITVLAGFLNKMEVPPAHSRRWTVRQTAEMLLLDSFFPSAPITVLAGILNKMDGLSLTAHRWTERQSAKMLPPGRWKVRQTVDALLLLCDTSGVDVKVSVVPNSDIRNGPLNSTQSSGVSNFLGMTRFASNLLGTQMYQFMVNQPAVLKIEHKSVKERENDEDIGYCTMLIDLPYNVYNTNAIKIEEENQVLKVTVPKLKSQWIGEVCFVYKEPKEECADMITLQGLKRLTWEPKYI